jgi:hypothetical protein
MVVGLVPLTYATLEHHQSPHVFVVGRLMPFGAKDYYFNKLSKYMSSNFNMLWCMLQPKTKIDAYGDHKNTLGWKL